MDQTLIKYPVVFAVGFLATYLLTPLVRGWAVKKGLVDLPDARRIHRVPTPRLGGVAVFLGFQAACVAIFCLPWHPFQSMLDFSWWWKFALISAFLVTVGIVAAHLKIYQTLLS